MTCTKSPATYALVALVFLLYCAVLWAQPAAAPATKLTPELQTEPTAIPLAEVPDRAEATTAELRANEAALAKDAVTARIASALTQLVREIDALEQETSRATRGEASLRVVQGLAASWQKLREALADFRRELTVRTARIEKDDARLAALEKRWTATLSAAEAPDAPRALRSRVQTTLDAIKKARAALDGRQADAIALLDRVARQDGRVSAALASLNSARDKAVGQLLARQAAPIWQLEAIEPATPSPVEAEQHTFAGQAKQLTDYARRNAETLAIHTLATLAIAATLFAVRRRIRMRHESVPALARAAVVFEMPIAAALVLSVLGSRWMYADAPRGLWALLGPAALIATVIILRRVADRRVLPILYAAIVFYVTDQLRLMLYALPLISRLLFIGEMLGGALFGSYLARWLARGAQRDTPLSKWTRRGAWAACAVFLAAAAANALGFTSLGDLLARSALSGAYSGVILYAAVLVVDAIALLALHVRPLALSRMVRQHTDRLWLWLRRLVRWIAVLLWAWFALDGLTLLGRVIALVQQTLAIGLTIGSLEITVGHLLAFGVTLWAAFFVSRLARFVLEQDVFTRVHLPSGLPYAIARTTHYLIVVVGFLVALAMLGVDMTKATILIGALTVGIGFGLQNIVNNFVSGLILLFERPVKIGDVIQIEDQVGVVHRIGIRASVIRTASGADVILPNGKFISDRVTNWTRATNYRPIELPIAVAGTSDARAVMALLARVAASQPGVAQTPPPEVLLAKFGADTLNLELRVWTDRADDWTRVRSDVALAVNEALSEAKIAIK